MVKVLGRRTVTALVTGVVLSGGASFSMVDAFAQSRPVDNVVSRADVDSLIDFSRKGSLSIHKYSGNPTGNLLDNTADGADNVLLERAEATFQVYKLDLDPKKFEDWQKFGKLNYLNPNVDDGFVGKEGSTVTSIPLEDGGVVNATKVSDISSTTSGPATLTEQELGFYYVVEVKQANTTNISPFLVSLPSSTIVGGQSSTSWNYDVHVHPKSQNVEVSKTVNDLYKSVGDKANYTINATVPQPAQGTDVLRQFAITDRQPDSITIDRDTVRSEFTFTYNSDDNYSAAKEISSVPGAELVTVDEEKKITVTINGVQNDTSALLNVRSSTTPENSRDTIFELTESGRNFVSQFMTLNAVGNAKFTYEATIGEIEVDGGENNQTNEVFLTADATADGSYTGTPDNPNPNDDSPAPPTSSVSSRFGKIEFNKVNTAGTGLSGAVFELHRCTDSTTYNSVENGRPELLADSRVTVNGMNQFTSGDDGTITITGIQLEDYANGVQNDGTGYDYCVVEVTAPKGYELRPDPIVMSVTTANPVSTVAQVENLEDSSSFIPRTGQAGMGIIAALGVFLATVFGFKASRKEKFAA